MSCPNCGQEMIDSLCVCGHDGLSEHCHCEFCLTEPTADIAIEVSNILKGIREDIEVDSACAVDKVMASIAGEDIDAGKIVYNWEGKVFQVKASCHG